MDFPASFSREYSSIITAERMSEPGLTYVLSGVFRRGTVGRFENGKIIADVRTGSHPENADLAAQASER